MCNSNCNCNRNNCGICNIFGDNNTLMWILILIIVALGCSCC